MRNRVEHDQQRIPIGRNGDERDLSATFLLGVPIDDVTMDEAVDVIFELVDDGRLNARTHQVATVNVDFVVNALEDEHLARLMQRTSLSIPDGMPIVWGSRLLGTPLRTRVAGADLVPALAARAASTGATLALFGSGPGVAERAAEVLRCEHPGARIVADPGPAFSSVDDISIDDLSPLIDAGADICCVAFGNPKQELFIDRFGPELDIPVMIGVGGTLDFLVGVKRRAPAWMRHTGLEWIHRLGSEPRRLAGRYARDALIFAPRLARQAWTGRTSTLAGAIAVRQNGSDHVVVDLGALLRADNRVAAELAGVARRAWRSGSVFCVRGARPDALQPVPGLTSLARRCEVQNES